MKEITLKELLETSFIINKKGEMVGEFTLKRINMICDILTNQYKEIERLNKYKNFIKSIIITLEPWSKNEKGYELHNISKQELYKELYELRQEILKGDGSNDNN